MSRVRSPSSAQIRSNRYILYAARVFYESAPDLRSLIERSSDKFHWWITMRTASIHGGVFIMSNVTSFAYVGQSCWIGTLLSLCTWEKINLNPRDYQYIARMPVRPIATVTCRLIVAALRGKYAVMSRHRHLSSAALLHSTRYKPIDSRIPPTHNVHLLRFLNFSVPLTFFLIVLLSLRTEILPCCHLCVLQ